MCQTDVMCTLFYGQAVYKKKFKKLLVSVVQLCGITFQCCHTFGNKVSLLFNKQIKGLSMLLEKHKQKDFIGLKNRK